MSNPRRRGGRGSESVRREQNWGSPRSGSPGSPGMNGSPRTGRRDRREPGQQAPPLTQSEHDIYVDYLQRKYELVQKQGSDNPGSVTYYKSIDTAEPGPTFDVDRFFIERQINIKQATSSPPHSQALMQHHQHHQQQNFSGLPS